MVVSASDADLSLLQKFTLLSPNQKVWPREFPGSHENSAQNGSDGDRLVQI